MGDDDDDDDDGWMNGGSLEVDGQFDVFHPCEPTQIFIFLVVSSLVADVVQDMLWTHEPVWLSKWPCGVEKKTLDLAVHDYD